MSDEKKLSFEDAKSVIESCYGFDDATTPAGEAWAIVNDKIADLEQRLEAAEANTQAAIDAALESLKTSCPACEYDEADGYLVDHCQECQRKIVTNLYSRKITSALPNLRANLSEAQSRIAELERDLAEARKDAERYRWAVENAIIETSNFKHDGRDPASTKLPLDNAIDAAMRQEGE